MGFFHVALHPLGPPLLGTWEHGKGVKVGLQLGRRGFPRSSALDLDSLDTVSQELLASKEELVVV